MNDKKDEMNAFRKNVRRAVADYMKSEGCTCCQDYEAHKTHAENLGRLLMVPKYKDGSGRDFRRFQTNE